MLFQFSEIDPIFDVCSVSMYFQSKCFCCMFVFNLFCGQCQNIVGVVLICPCHVASKRFREKIISDYPSRVFFESDGGNFQNPITHLTNRCMIQL